MKNIYSDEFHIPATLTQITGADERHAVFRIEFLYAGQKHVETFEMYLDEKAESWIEILAVLVLESSIRKEESQKHLSKLWGSGKC